jgi:hypothetical protein
MAEADEAEFRRIGIGRKLASEIQAFLRTQHKPGDAQSSGNSVSSPDVGSFP